MTEILIRPAEAGGATDGRTSAADPVPVFSRRRRRPRGRLWALLNAQALLGGQTMDGIGIEDDRGRMAGRRAR